MKKLLPLFFLLLLASGASAQQDEKFNHYMFNSLVLNPAYAGVGDCFQTLLVYRPQWTGFGDGVPTTSTASIHSPFNFDLDNSRIETGAGLHVINDELGGFQAVQGVKLALSYRRPLLGGKISIAPSLGLIQQSIQGTELEPLQPGDPFIPTGNVSSLAFDLGAGIYYDSNKLFGGISVTHLNAPKLKDANSSVEIPLTPHLFVTGGYRYQLNTNFMLQPSFLVKSDFATTQFDVTALAFYKDKFWGGMAYTSEDAVVAMVGMQKLLDKFTFGYAYQFTTSQLAGNVGSTHEIIFGYNFCISRPPKILNPIKNVRDL